MISLLPGDIRCLGVADVQWGPERSCHSGTAWHFEKDKHLDAPEIANHGSPKLHWHQGNAN